MITVTGMLDVLLPAFLRSFCRSLADCVMFKYMVLVCWISASWVASLADTSAPSVTRARPMRPEIGACTLA